MKTYKIFLTLQYDVDADNEEAALATANKSIHQLMDCDCMRRGMQINVGEIEPVDLEVVK